MNAKAFFIVLSIILVALFQSGCGISESAKSTIVAKAIQETKVFEDGINTAISKTQEALPTETVTPTSDPTSTPMPVSGNLIQFLSHLEIKTGSGWYGEPGDYPIPVASEFVIHFYITGEGHFPSVSIQGLSEKDSQRRNTIYVVAGPENIYLEIGDGKSDFSKVNKDLPLKSGDKFSILFHDINGREISILDSEGNILRKYDLTSIPGIEMPDGLFPFSELFIGTLVSPNAGLLVHELDLEIIDE